MRSQTSNHRPSLPYLVASLYRVISADRSDTFEERVLTMHEHGDDGPDESRTDFKGVLHIERGCLGLTDVPRLGIDVEDRLELMDGKWSRKDNNVLHVARGPGCAPGLIASDPSGLMRK